MQILFKFLNKVHSPEISTFTEKKIFSCAQNISMMISELGAFPAFLHPAARLHRGQFFPLCHVSQVLRF